ncbi:MAG: hypothetical protein AAFN78_03975 [Pseudomonadota bacterium]
MKKHETYREYYSAQRSGDGFRYEQKIDDTLVYTKILETEYEDVAGSGFWTKKRRLGAPYRFLIASLNYSGAQEPLVVVGAWLSIDGGPEIPLQLSYPLAISYKDGDSGTAFRSASYSVALDGVLDYKDSREVISRVDYKQPGNEAVLSLKTRFESRSKESSITDLEILLFGG